MGDIKELLPSYIRSLNVVLSCEQRADARGPEGRDDRIKLGEMETDLRFALHWLRGESMPGPKRGIERRSREQRTICLREAKLEAAAHRAARLVSRPADLETLPAVVQCKVNKVMLYLSTRQRQAFMLRYVSGYSHTEIAEVMGVTESTVRATTHAARKKLLFLVQ